jgi:hypothetical protein
MVSLERLGDPSPAIDPDAHAIDVADRPVPMALKHHVGIVALGEGLHRRPEAYLKGGTTKQWLEVQSPPDQAGQKP